MQKYPDIFVRGFLLTVVIDRDRHVSQVSPHIFYNLATRYTSRLIIQPKVGLFFKCKNFSAEQYIKQYNDKIRVVVFDIRLVSGQNAEQMTGTSKYR